MKAKDMGELAAFIVIAREKSFRRAAAKLNVIPSTLSHSMRALETRLATASVRLDAKTS